MKIVIFLQNKKVFIASYKDYDYNDIKDTKKL